MEFFDKRLVDAVKRADVYYYHDWNTNSMHLVSRNLEDPLTDEEKKLIKDHFSMRLFPLEVVFDN